MYKFNNIITHVPTACLIEDYQTLQLALNAIDICPHDTQEHIRCVMECLASVIDSCTEVPAGLDIKPPEYTQTIFRKRQRKSLPNTHTPTLEILFHRIYNFLNIFQRSTSF